jgi:hypothetical protein
MQKFALTSSTSGGRLVGTVRSRTKTTEFFFTCRDVLIENLMVSYLVKNHQLLYNPKAHCRIHKSPLTDISLNIISLLAQIFIPIIQVHANIICSATLKSLSKSNIKSNWPRAKHSAPKLVATNGDRKQYTYGQSRASNK